MKKLLIVLLSALCAFTLFACKKANGPTGTPGSGNKEPEFLYTKAYNTASGENETIMVKLLDVTTDPTAIDAVIAGYSGIYDLSAVPENAKWVLISYELMWPEGTEVGEYGSIPSVDPDVTDKETLKGGVIRYEGTSWIISTIDIVRPDDFYWPGESGLYKALAPIPETMPIEDLVVRFGWEDYVLVDINGVIIPAPEE